MILNRDLRLAAELSRVFALLLTTMVYADLNVPWPSAHIAHLLAGEPYKKGKPEPNVDIWRGMPEDDRRSLRARTECAIRRASSLS